MSVISPSRIVVVATPEEMAALRLPAYAFDYWEEERQREWLDVAIPAGRPDTPYEISQILSPGSWYGVSVDIFPNFDYYSVRRAEWPWQKTLESGRSYMVGTDVSMNDFLRHHSSAVTPWQKAAYKWALLNPLWKLSIETSTRHWKVYARGKDFVEFALPHQDKGGERHYISRDCRIKIQVNQD